MDLIKDKLKYIDKCYLRETYRGGGYGGAGDCVEQQYIRILDISKVKIKINLAKYGIMDITNYQMENIIEKGEEITLNEWILQTVA
tara:strand:- start:1436 stop:1693 length:258 start_codon:yes stop_codon:yes gene_type:complete